MSIPTHHSVEVDAGDRGRAFGQAHAPAVANTIMAYRRLFQAAREIDLADIRELGIEVGEQLTIDWPELHEEIAGIAAGAGIDEAELLAVNARTEILAGTATPECSTIGILPEASANRACILAQNWDWHPDLAASRVLWTVHEPSGRWFTTLTEAGILAKIGVSSAGMGCCLNLLATTIDGGVAGVPIHILLRLVLQRCDRLSDALYLLLNAPASASSCITVGQADNGEAMMVSVEVSPGGAKLIWPNHEGWLVHTNHFLAVPAIGEDRYAREFPDTLIRQRQLERRLARESGPFTAGDVQTLLRSHFNEPLSVCCHAGENREYRYQAATLASIVIDLATHRMLVTDGSPCLAKYEEAPTELAASH